MKAVRLESEGRLPEVTEVTRPVIGPNDVLVEVRAASVCGSDVYKWSTDFEPAVTPVTLGHEGAGVVVEVGNEVAHLSEGDRVVLDYMVACGECRQCVRGYNNRCRYQEALGKDRDGTFAEYVAVPSTNAIRLPASVPFEQGSVVGCAGATGYHAVNVAETVPGDVVVVFGIGGVGLHAVLWADYVGAGTVVAVDPVAGKLEGARAYGADVLVDPETTDPLEVIEETTDGWGADAAIECSGSAVAMEQAIACVKGRNQRASGNVVSVGLQHEPMAAEYWGLREGKLAVSGNHTRAEFQELLELLDAGAVDLSNSVSHTLPLDGIDEAIELVTGGDVPVARVVLDVGR